MQSVLKVQQENAPNIEEWYRKQQAGVVTLFDFASKNCATYVGIMYQTNSTKHSQNR
jgi:hypothetical protein